MATYGGEAVNGMRKALAATSCAAIMIASGQPAGAVPRPGRTERISIGWNGADPNGGSSQASMSADGRYVAFTSGASNLVPGDTNGRLDVFVRDRVTGSTVRASQAPDGTEGLGTSLWGRISGDGRYVAFYSDSPNILPDADNLAVDVFVRDLITGSLQIVSMAPGGAAANGDASNPSISRDGRIVVFESDASNLVPGDTNGEDDVFAHDQVTGITTRVSVATDGTEANSVSFEPNVSSDGRFVAFRSPASNLVVGDLNGAWDIFVHDLQARVTERVSVASDGSEAATSSDSPSITADGRYVAFQSAAPNLVPNDGALLDGLGRVGTFDAFVHDRLTGRTQRVSVASSGAAPNGLTFEPVINGNGRYVAFESWASNLVSDDTNDVGDMFVHDRLLGITELVSLGPHGSPGVIPESMTGDGRFLGFSGGNVFVRDRGPALGLGEVEVTPAEETLDVSGWARFAGDVVRVADPAEVPGLDRSGSEILGASVAHRPEEGDLSFTIELAWIPGVRASYGVVGPFATGRPGFSIPPGVLYGGRFTTGGTAYELRAFRSGSTDPPVEPRFGLYRCETTCSQVAALEGGLGTTGDEVRIALPLSALGPSPAGALTEISAFTAIGDPSTPVPRGIDEVALGSLGIEQPRVEVGFAPTGTAERDVTFVPATLQPDGTFAVEVSRAGLHGSHEVWARACLGNDCASRTTEVML
jgi:Tol biopolymer transport system component